MANGSATDRLRRRNRAVKRSVGAGMLCVAGVYGNRRAVAPQGPDDENRERGPNDRLGQRGKAACGARKVHPLLRQTSSASRDGCARLGSKDVRAKAARILRNRRKA
jgi:hypothetical protein